MTVPGCDHNPPCPDPEAHEAITLAEVRNAIAGTGAISGTGSGADARYMVDGAWVDRSEAERLGRLPDGEDGGVQADADYEALFPPGLPLPDVDDEPDGPDPFAKWMEHHDRQIRTAVLLPQPDLGNRPFLEGLATWAAANPPEPPNAIPVMVPEEAEPVGWVNDGPWEYPVSHWPGGLRGAKAAAMEADRGRHPVYGLPPVTGTVRPPQPLPVAPKRLGGGGGEFVLMPPVDTSRRARVKARPPAAEPLTGRQPREIRGPRPAASAVTPAIRELLDRCPVCGMSDLGDLLHGKLAEWEGWPVHADCAEWIAGSDPAVAVLPAPESRRLPSRAVAAVALLACMYVSSLVMAVMWLPAWGLISPLFGIGSLLLALWVRWVMKR